MRRYRKPPRGLKMRLWTPVYPIEVEEQRQQEYFLLQIRHKQERNLAP